MREIRTSGLMSGEGKRVASVIPRLSSTLLVNILFPIYIEPRDFSGGWVCQPPWRLTGGVAP
jgi:hypothetical protein